MRRSRWNWRRAGVAAGIGVLAVGALASVGAAVSPKRTSAAGAQYQPHKVMLCHHTHSKKNPFVTIIVAKKALPAHLRHGDTIGPCASTGPIQVTPKPKTKAKGSHGKSRAAAKKAATVVPAVAPDKQGATTKGRSSTAPGHAATAPGHSGSAPGHVTESGAGRDHSGRGRRPRPARARARRGIGRARRTAAHRPATAAPRRARRPRRPARAGPRRDRAARLLARAALRPAGKDK